MLKMGGATMSDLMFVIVVLSIDAGLLAGLWLVVRRAVREMEQ